MSHQKQPCTPGGFRLRALREACGKTQLDVELDANLGIGYLQRLELGKVRQPEQATLDRILDVLETGFLERRELLGLFGYAVNISIPTARESQWAIDIFHAEIKQAAMPVYLLDCAHRLLAWNEQVTNLFGGLNAVPRPTLIPRLIFDSVNGIGGAIMNAETFFSAQVRVIHYERQRCGTESLYNAFVNEMSTVPAFAKYWHKGEVSDRVQVPMRPLVPMKLDSGQGMLQFRLIAEPFVQDPRFRVIYYMPDDTITLRQCLEWQG